MTRDEQLALIRSRCIAANYEEILKRRLQKSSRGVDVVEVDYPIRLADLLLAILEKWGEYRLSNTNVYGVDGLLDSWNLHKDDLTEQSDEFIQFAYDLLK